MVLSKIFENPLEGEIGVGENNGCERETCKMKRWRK